MKEKTSIQMADFKAHLSRYIREVRRGHSLTLLDRHTPVARVLPYSPGAGKLAVRPPSRSTSQIQFPRSIGKKIDILGYAVRERQRQR